MFIKLLEARSYRGKEYKEGDIIEVEPSLGGAMVLNGVGVRAPGPAESKDLEKLKKAELVELVLSKDGSKDKTELEKLTKEELIALLS